MCMLTYYPPDVQPDIEGLRNGAQFNRDGHGYAIVVPGKYPRLIVRHSMNSESLIERFARDRERYPSGPALFHSRFGTSGIKGKFNCHPFRLAGNKQTVVAHNGVLPADMQPDRKDKRCDTRMAADDIFATKYGRLAKKATRRRLGAAIGKNNKLVILSVDPTLASAYIINESSGVWENGIWYSNYDFEPYVPTTTKLGSWDYGWRNRDDWLTDEDCKMCFSKKSVDAKNQVCTFCYACADCTADINDCMCYPGTEVVEEPQTEAVDELTKAELRAWGWPDEEPEQFGYRWVDGVNGGWVRTELDDFDDIEESA